VFAFPRYKPPPPTQRRTHAFERERVQVWIGSKSKGNLLKFVSSFKIDVFLASYGIELIWQFLKVSDFEKLDKVKSRYFKKVMGCSKYNKNTYIYKLVDDSLFVTDLRQMFDFPETEN